MIKNDLLTHWIIQHKLDNKIMDFLRYVRDYLSNNKDLVLTEQQVGTINKTILDCSGLPGLMTPNGYYRKKDPGHAIMIETILKAMRKMPNNRRFAIEDMEDSCVNPMLCIPKKEKDIELYKETVLEEHKTKEVTCYGRDIIHFDEYTLQTFFTEEHGVCYDLEHIRVNISPNNMPRTSFNAIHKKKVVGIFFDKKDEDYVCRFLVKASSFLECLLGCSCTLSGQVRAFPSLFGVFSYEEICVAKESEQIIEPISYIKERKQLQMALNHEYEMEKIRLEHAKRMRALRRQYEVSN